MKSLWKIGFVSGLKMVTLFLLASYVVGLVAVRLYLNNISTTLPEKPQTLLSISMPGFVMADVTNGLSSTQFVTNRVISSSNVSPKAGDLVFIPCQNVVHQVVQETDSKKYRVRWSIIRPNQPDYYEWSMRDERFNSARAAQNHILDYKKWAEENARLKSVSVKTIN